MPTTYFGLNTSATVPAISSLTAVTTLTDGSAGDTFSWPTPNSVNSVQSSPIYSATCFAFAICDLGSVLSVTAAQFTWKVVIGNDFGSVGGKSATAVLEYASNTTNGTDGSWTSLGTNTIGLVSAGGGTYGPQTFNPTFAPVSANMVRVRFTLTTTSGSNPTFAEIDASDFRVSYSGGCTPPSNPTLTAQGVVIGANYISGLGGNPVILLSN